MHAPDPPPLPFYRMTDSHPFTVTGLDFTGAIYVKTPRGQEKVYICLFTCANTRAVHLEVVTNLTVPTFITAFLTKNYGVRQSINLPICRRRVDPTSYSIQQSWKPISVNEESSGNLFQNEHHSTVVSGKD
jgi:hypothetical protein